MIQRKHQEPLTFACNVTTYMLSSAESQLAIWSAENWNFMCVFANTDYIYNQYSGFWNICFNPFTCMSKHGYSCWVILIKTAMHRQRLDASIMSRRTENVIWASSSSCFLRCSYPGTFYHLQETWWSCLAPRHLWGELFPLAPEVWCYPVCHHVYNN